MKLLVFAHTPPPHHGQSYMVKLMLEGFGGDRRRKRNEPEPDRQSDPYGIECYHVNARLSRDLEDIGEFRPAKVLLLLWYCLQAIWCRFRYGVDTLYYVPAPGKRSALFRDWLVMTLCRPFFKKVVLHWHAAGLAKWLETHTQMRTRAMTYRAYRNVDLSIVLSSYNRRDAEKLWPKEIRIVPNGIPDPCPNFETSVLPRRRARVAARLKLLSGVGLTPGEVQAAGGDPHIFKVLFLGHCTRDKGLFDTMDGVALANAKLAELGIPIRAQLVVAGGFMHEHEQAEFEARLAAQNQLVLPGFPVATVPGQPESVSALVGARSSLPQFTYMGFVSGAAKASALRDADCLCFPTYYHAESFGLVIIEAMAFGLPVVASNWRSIPEIVPPGYPGLVQPRSPKQIADGIIKMLTFNDAEVLRARFLERFSLEQYLKGMAEAIRSLDKPGVAHAAAVQSRPVV
ncbi:MAG: glycosyltransferase family 4 protein [Verrucomicrobiae bacterium]|nr:glycosyltransferase family 4 protein [Verrucomicrobiae bacterium]